MCKGNYIVYRHVSPDNKMYVGITCQKINRRWENGNGYRSNPYFTRAIKKLGKEKPLVDINGDMLNNALFN